MPLKFLDNASGYGIIACGPILDNGEGATAIVLRGMKFNKAKKEVFVYDRPDDIKQYVVQHMTLRFDVAAPKPIFKSTHVFPVSETGDRETARRIAIKEAFELFYLFSLSRLDTGAL